MSLCQAAPKGRPKPSEAPTETSKNTPTLSRRSKDNISVRSSIRRCHSRNRGRSRGWNESRRRSSTGSSRHRQRISDQKYKENEARNLIGRKAQLAGPIAGFFNKSAQSLESFLHSFPCESWSVLQGRSNVAKSACPKGLVRFGVMGSFSAVRQGSKRRRCP